MKRIILCLDGTWNSAYVKGKRDDGSEIVKPSNVLKLARSVKPKGGRVDQVVYYDTGVGSMSKYPGFSNYLLGKMDNIFGGGWGAGFEANLEQAMHFLVNNYNNGDEIYIFGFSRGAATARALTKFIDWLNGVPVKLDVYYLPALFRNYIKQKGKKSAKDIKHKIKQEVEKRNEKRSHKHELPFKDWQTIKIKFLGVWDTVLSLGGRILPVTNRKYYLGEQPAFCVENARQALAIDEKRFDFKPWIWDKPANDDQSLKQRWFAGVHSNIGGGYVKDGLANITLHWIKDEILSVEPSFQFEDVFFNKYKKYIQAELVDSKKLFYKAKDFLMRKDGVRKIVSKLDSGYKQSGLVIDFTALQRIKSRPQARNENGDLIFPQLDLYRPENLLKYIRSQDREEFMQVYKEQAALMNIKDEKRRLEQIEKMTDF